jgi:hypothetical protein
MRKIASRLSEDAYDGGILPLPDAVTGSAGSKPTVASRTTAMSATVLAIGPPVSCVCPNGMMPARLDRPADGRSPTIAL